MMNTIKLNRILNNDISFEAIECFTNRSSKKALKITSNNNSKKEIKSDEDSRYALRQFIVIMSLHCGFTGFYFVLLFNKFLKK